MTINLSGKVREGLAPEEFIERMTRNQDKFLHWQTEFAWPNEKEKSYFTSFDGAGDLQCLILAADWCGDVVRNVPVVLQLMKAAKIPTKILIMEEHLEVMDQFLTMGGRSIPVVLLLGPNGLVIAKWGPRPSYVQEPMTLFKQNNPDKNAPDYEDKLKAARSQIMLRYGENAEYQTLIVKEVREVLEAIRA